MQLSHPGPILQSWSHRRSNLLDAAAAQEAANAFSSSPVAAAEADALTSLGLLQTSQPGPAAGPQLPQAMQAGTGQAPLAGPPSGPGQAQLVSPPVAQMQPQPEPPQVAGTPIQIPPPDLQPVQPQDPVSGLRESSVEASAQSPTATASIPAAGAEALAVLRDPPAAEPPAPDSAVGSAEARDVQPSDAHRGGGAAQMGEAGAAASAEPPRGLHLTPSEAAADALGTSCVGAHWL